MRLRFPVLFGLGLFSVTGAWAGSYELLSTSFYTYASAQTSASDLLINTDQSASLNNTLLNSSAKATSASGGSHTDSTIVATYGASTIDLVGSTQVLVAGPSKSGIEGAGEADAIVEFSIATDSYIDLSLTSDTQGEYVSQSPVSVITLFTAGSHPTFGLTNFGGGHRAVDATHSILPAGSYYFKAMASVMVSDLPIRSASYSAHMSIVPVPEPATFAVVGLGLAGVVRRRRRG